jgi:hypothetical protein
MVKRQTRKNYSKKGGNGSDLNLKGGSSNLTGSEYAGASPSFQEGGTPYVGFNLSQQETSTVAGSYAPVQQGVHQCGGSRRSRKNKTMKQKRRQRKQQKGKSQKQRKQSKKQRR